MTHSYQPPANSSNWALYKSLLLPVYLPSLLMSICQGSVILIIPLFALDLSGSAAITALVFAFRGLGNMAIDIPAGWATARFGDKAVMMTGIVLTIVTALIASAADTAVTLAIAGFVFGTAVAMWMLARLAFISEAVPLQQRGKAISSMAGLQRFGNLIGPVTSGFIVELYGFSYAFLAVAIVAAIALVLVWFAVKNHTSEATDHDHNLLTMLPVILKRHKQVFATAGVAILCLTILRASRSLLVPLWGASIGLDDSTIGLVVGISAGIDMCMFPIAGWTMDNLGRRYAAVVCMVLLASGLALIPFTNTFLTLTLATIVAGIGNGLGSGINMTLGADFAPDNERGQFLGVWRLVSDSGSFAGPLLLGQITGLLGLTAGFWVVALLGIVGAGLIITKVQETLVKTPG